MTIAEWVTVVTAYPFVVALLLAWIRGATKHPGAPPPPRPTMTVAVFGRPVARWQIIEHAAPDGEVLEFPVFEGRCEWTVDQVADAIAEIDRLPEVVK